MMDIIRCILKIYPDWKGMVRENDYNQITPNETETRPIPTMDELKKAWIVVQIEQEKEAEIQAEIAKIKESENQAHRIQAIANIERRNKDAIIR